MSVATIGFFVSALVAMAAGLVAVAARKPTRSLAGFAIALAALIVPLIQLRAPAVAGVLLLCMALVVALLGGLGALAPARGEASLDGFAVRRGSPSYWILAGLGVLGFVWVLLATGSRQVVEALPPLTRRAAFGEGSAVLSELAAEHLVSALVVGLLALCSVIAAVLTLVGERERDRSQQAHSSQHAQPLSSP